MHHQPSPSDNSFLAPGTDVSRPLHHTLEAEGQWEKGIPACFLPSSSPSRKPTLASSHWFLNCVLKFLWVNTAPTWHPYNACEIRGVMQM